MILVTGGAGFIGSHTVRALHEAGEECVLLQRRTPALPPRLADVPAAMARGDIADLESLRAVGSRYAITGIVHLAITPPWAADDEDAIGAAGRALDGFLNIVRVAKEWGVRRVVVASTIGVYGGVPVDGALGEDLPLPMRHFHAIPTLKKITELLAGQLAAESGIEIVAARISGTWGPGGHLPDPFFPASSLAHAAAHRTTPTCPASRTSRTPRTPSTSATSRTPAVPSPFSSSHRSCATPRTTSARAGRRAMPR